MKYILPVFLLVSTPAFAQSPPLEQACLSVLQNFLMKPQVKTGISQSFPELKPAGARISYAERDNVEPSDMDDVIDCQFQKPTAPFGLIRFCISSTCYSADEQNADRKRRFEEVRALMDRQAK
ncbi:hypothetical protein [Rhizobium paknamense]|uniref:UrcA family protein n=1 Tax=Rhizobium paknamense TaxID=1206817 RepID=A0ABU0IDQ5_9HYPH|nr:hypothetical protein [Rhizobium paknamense]MDQ0456378.1 hypothetical protein [Rhizobium paknamense]